VAEGLAGDLAKIRTEFGLAVPDDLLARGTLAWTSLFGAVSFEVFGQYGAGNFTARDELFGHQLAVLADVAGLPPAGAMLPGVLEAWLTLLVAVAAATGLGLLVSALAPNEDRAIALVPYVLLPQFLLAGVAFDVPEWLEPVQFLTIAYWSISGLGGTVNVCAHPFGGASTCARALGMPFGHGVADIVSRWLVLGALALAAWGIAWLVLARRDAARRYR
jgi:hypothetical protein